MCQARAYKGIYLFMCFFVVLRRVRLFQGWQVLTWPVKAPSSERGAHQRFSFSLIKHHRFCFIIRGVSTSEVLWDLGTVCFSCLWSFFQKTWTGNRFRCTGLHCLQAALHIIAGQLNEDQKDANRSNKEEEERKVNHQPLMQIRTLIVLILQAHSTSTWVLGNSSRLGRSFALHSSAGPAYWWSVVIGWAHAKAWFSCKLVKSTCEVFSFQILFDAR